MHKHTSATQNNVEAEGLSLLSYEPCADTVIFLNVLHPPL